MVATSSIRALFVVALVFGSACGGRQSGGTTAVALPPADPAAVRELVAGSRRLQRGGRGNLRLARRHFERAIELHENLWEAHYNLGVMERRAGNIGAAVARFEAARSIQPSAEEPARALAEAHHAAGRLQEAAQVLDTYVAAFPDAVDVRVSFAMLERERERYGSALAQAREVLIRDPAHVRALLEVGRVYRAREQFDVARLVLDKALTNLPQSSGNVRVRAEIHNEAGLLELARGDTQAAFDAFELAVAADPSFAPANLNRGSVLLRAGDYAGAAEAFQAVLELDADDLDARVAHGAALRGAGQHRVARREYERVLQAAPDHLGATFNLGVLLADFLDERPRARELFVRFMQIAPARHPKREDAQRYLDDIPAPAPRPGEQS